jgi:hypothetical protein
LQDIIRFAGGERSALHDRIELPDTVVQPDIEASSVAAAEHAAERHRQLTYGNERGGQTLHAIRGGRSALDTEELVPANPLIVQSIRVKMPHSAALSAKDLCSRKGLMD